MKASAVLTVLGDGAKALGQLVAARLHIPFADMDAGISSQSEDAFLAQECRTITDFLSQNGKRFAVISADARAMDYMPSALLLSARTTVCFVGDGTSPFADFSVAADTAAETIIAQWLSPELLSSFSSKPQ